MVSSDQLEGRKELWGAFIPFFYLVESSFGDRLEACEREGCGSYFLRGIRLDGKEGRANARYCARRCGHLRAALKSTRDARREAWEAKVARAERARAEMKRLNRQPADPKRWLARRAKVTTNFIAINHLLRPAPLARLGIVFADTLASGGDR